VVFGFATPEPVLERAWSHFNISDNVDQVLLNRPPSPPRGQRVLAPWKPKRVQTATVMVWSMKARTMNVNVRRAVAAVSYPMTTTMKK
jgi:hypothetical protein